MTKKYSRKEQKKKDKMDARNRANESDKKVRAEGTNLFDMHVLVGVRIHLEIA